MILLDPDLRRILLEILPLLPKSEQSCTSDWPDISTRWAQSVDTSSKFYRPNQRYAYHSKSVGHDTEECFNIKHEIQDLIDQEVVFLQTVAPNVNTNPLPNHGCVNINMIDIDDD